MKQARQLIPWNKIIWHQTHISVTCHKYLRCGNKRIWVAHIQYLTQKVNYILAICHRYQSIQYNQTSIIFCNTRIIVVTDSWVLPRMVATFIGEWRSLKLHLRSLIQVLQIVVWVCPRDELHVFKHAHFSGSSHQLYARV